LRESLGRRFDDEFASGAASTFQQALALAARLGAGSD
jgi:hypothetical protein